MNKLETIETKKLESLTANSKTMVLWRCPKCQHEYKMRVCDRVKKGDNYCPKCSDTKKR